MSDPKKTQGEDRRGTNEPWKHPGQSSQQPRQEPPPKIDRDAEDAPARDRPAGR
jgi:hypothetical protein